MYTNFYLQRSNNYTAAVILDIVMRDFQNIPFPLIGGGDVDGKGGGAEDGKGGGSSSETF